MSVKICLLFVAVALGDPIPGRLDPFSPGFGAPRAYSGDESYQDPQKSIWPTAEDYYNNGYGRKSLQEEDYIYLRLPEEQTKDEIDNFNERSYSLNNVYFSPTDPQFAESAQNIHILNPQKVSETNSAESFGSDDGQGFRSEERNTEYSSGDQFESPTGSNRDYSTENSQKPIDVREPRSKNSHVDSLEQMQGQGSSDDDKLSLRDQQEEEDEPPIMKDSAEIFRKEYLKTKLGSKVPQPRIERHTGYRPHLHSKENYYRKLLHRRLKRGYGRRYGRYGRSDELYGDYYYGGRHHGPYHHKGHSHEERHHHIKHHSKKHGHEVEHEEEHEVEHGHGGSSEEYKVKKNEKYAGETDSVKHKKFKSYQHESQEIIGNENVKIKFGDGNSVTLGKLEAKKKH